MSSYHKYTMITSKGNLHKRVELQSNFSLNLLYLPGCMPVVVLCAEVTDEFVQITPSQICPGTKGSPITVNGLSMANCYDSFKSAVLSYLN